MAGANIFGKVRGPTSNHVQIPQGTTLIFYVDLVDDDAEPVDLARLMGATAEMLVRQAPTDVVDIVKKALVLQVDAPVIPAPFDPVDTSFVALGGYTWRIRLSLASGAVFDVVPWSELDVVVGGSATPPPPVFDNTVEITADYPLSDDMTYRTPGGSPIENAQVRVYKKSDFDAGNLLSPVGVTTTDAGGKWVQPILVAPGLTYVARLEKPYEFGPDIKEFVA